MKRSARRAAVLGLYLAVVVVAASSAADASGHIVLQQRLAPEGGSVSAYAVDVNGDHPVTWRACAGEGGSCHVVDDGGDPHDYSFTQAPAGTVFEASTEVDGVPEMARSDPWTGPLRLVSPPELVEAPRVGHLVTPRPARWEGGWSTDASYPQTQVCPSSAGADGCLAIGDALFWGGCGPYGAAIPAARYEGWYVRIVDRRAEKNPIVTLIGYTQPEGIGAAQPAAPLSVASEMSGPIGPATGAPESDCSAQSLPWPRTATTLPSPVPRPTAKAKSTATLEATITARHGRATIGSVTCPDRCTVDVRVVHGRRHVTRRQRMSSAGRRSITLSARDLHHLRPGRLTVRILIDGHLVGRRLARLTAGPAH
jgi:hypothetical protein